jgi:hypothetical protein
MSEFTDRPETDRGKALFEELLWVHRMVRRDLDTVRRLADECLEGRPAAPVVDRLESEHRNVSGLLDEVEHSTNALTERDGDGSRRRLADALLASRMTSSPHLSYEGRTCGRR